MLADPKMYYFLAMIANIIASNALEDIPGNLKCNIETDDDDVIKAPLGNMSKCIYIYSDETYFDDGFLVRTDSRSSGQYLILEYEYRDANNETDARFGAEFIVRITIGTLKTPFFHGDVVPCTSTQRFSKCDVNDSVCLANCAKVDWNLDVATSLTLPKLQSTSDETEVVDISLQIFHTEESLKYFGHSELLNHFRVHSMTNFTNGCLARSGVYVRLRVTKFSLFDFTTDKDDRVRDLLDTFVSRTKDSVKADLAVLFVRKNNFRLFGAANKIAGTHAVVGVGYGEDDDYDTFAHEVGHLLGARHDTDMRISDERGALLLGGRRTTVTNFRSRFTTIIPYYSNPLVVLPDGHPLGNKWQNNAKAMNDNRFQVAARYRDSNGSSDQMTFESILSEANEEDNDGFDAAPKSINFEIN